MPEEFKQPAIAEVEARDQQPSSLQGLRVLVVDDEIDARTLLTMMLEKCGAQVVAVGSSREGLGVDRELEARCADRRYWDAGGRWIRADQESSRAAEEKGRANAGAGVDGLCENGRSRARAFRGLPGSPREACGSV